MPRKLRLLLDVDGVIADFPQYYLDIVQAKFGVAHSVEAINKWNIGESIQLHPDRRDIVRAALQEPGVAMSLRAYPGSVKAVRKLRKMLDLFFVTSPLGSSTWTDDRERWLEAHFFTGDKPRVTHTHEKYICFGDVFVDDKVDHIKAWSEAWPNSTAVIWDQPWNRKFNVNGRRNVLRMNRWEQLFSLVEELMSKQVHAYVG